MYVYNGEIRSFVQVMASRMFDSNHIGQLEKHLSNISTDIQNFSLKKLCPPQSSVHFLLELICSPEFFIVQHFNSLQGGRFDWLWGLLHSGHNRQLWNALWEFPTAEFPPQPQKVWKYQNVCFKTNSDLSRIPGHGTKASADLSGRPKHRACDHVTTYKQPQNKTNRR